MLAWCFCVNSSFALACSEQELAVSNVFFWLTLAGEQVKGCVNYYTSGMFIRMVLFCLLLNSIGVAFGAEKCLNQTSIISWNVQTFGNLAPARKAVCVEAYRNVISSHVTVLAVQELINQKGEALFLSLLPGASQQWGVSFEDTSSSHDNGVFYRAAVATITAQGFVYGDTPSKKPDRSKVLHPARWAHIRVDDFDFTIVSLHLTYQKGDTRESKREMLNILDWLVQYFKDPKSDPDVILAGDFNLPSSKGKPLSKRKKEASFMTLESIIQEHGKFLTGPRKLSVLIDEPTSRSRKGAGNNYDHFILTQSVLERLISADRVPVEIVDKVDAGKDVRVSDHYPIVTAFCTQYRP